MKLRIEKTVVCSGQNIVDLVIQEMGHIEGFLSLCRMNSLAPTQNLAPGTVILTRREEIVNDPTREFFKRLNLKVNTGYDGLPSDKIFDETFDDSFE